MTLPSIRCGLAGLVVFLAVFLAAPNSFAQYQQAQPPASSGAQSQAPKDGQTAARPRQRPKPIRKKRPPTKSFNDTKPEDADKRIQLGEAYVLKYPNGKYVALVYSGLTVAEYGKLDLPKMYADSDKALALNPDDVNVLVLVGWVIPHKYDPNDLAAESQLAKAEKYEKHALEVLAALPKPANLTDEQFAKVKAEGESQAHSGLGLIYFRRQNYAESVEELKKSTMPTPRIRIRPIITSWAWILLS